MTPTITSVNLNETPESDLPETPIEEQVATPPTNTPGTAAEDIDTDELEALLVDLKEAKKRTKTLPKKRIRKPKKVAIVGLEPEPIEEEPVVIDESFVPEPEAFLEPGQKPKRKYIRKAKVEQESPQLPLDAPAAEPAKRTPVAMIEEMQRAERALRYQMRKNKMQTLVSQAF